MPSSPSETTSSIVFIYILFLSFLKHCVSSVFCVQKKGLSTGTMGAGKTTTIKLLCGMLVNSWLL